MQKVKVFYAPISERYWYIGCTGLVHNGQINVGGCWFDFDQRWIIK